MNKLETPQAVENTESTESAEGKSLQETAAEPGSRVEETQTFEQAEAVETSLTNAVKNVEISETSQPVPMPSTGDNPSAYCVPGDLPPGSGTLGDPNESVEIADKLEDRGIADRAEVPEGLEFKPAGEEGTVDPNDHSMVDPSELREASGDDDDKDEATPINVPSPIAADESISPMPIPNMEPAEDKPDSGSKVSEAPTEEPVPLPED